MHKDKLCSANSQPQTYFCPPLYIPYMPPKELTDFQNLNWIEIIWVMKVGPQAKGLPALFRLQCVHESPGSLLECKTWLSSWAKILIPNRPPGETDAAGLRTVLWVGGEGELATWFPCLAAHWTHLEALEITDTWNSHRAATALGRGFGFRNVHKLPGDSNALLWLRATAAGAAPLTTLVYPKSD